MSKQAAPQETPERKPYALYKQLPLANQGIQPPAPLFVTRDEALLVRIWNSAASPVVHFTGRLLLPNGDVREIYRRIVPNTDRSVLTTTVGLEDGYLLSCALAADMTTYRGQTWCKVALVRPPLAYQQSAQPLISDYLETGQQIGWPGCTLRSSLDGPGFLRIITGTDPAAGAEVSETVPTNARWRFLALQVTLVTDGTGSARRFLLIADDGTTGPTVSIDQSTQAISTTEQYHVMVSGTEKAVASTRHTLAFPLSNQLLGGWRVRTTTTNLSTGDNYGAPILWVEEWIEE